VNLNMKYRGIGIIGKAWSGKSTVALMLKKYGFVKYSFATPLKVAVVDLFGISKLTNRRLLQSVGTALRSVDPYVFVNKAISKIKQTNPETPIVIDDVRFKNEAEALRNLNFLLIRINRPCIRDPTAEGHQSETEQDFIVADIEIVNDGTLEKLMRDVDDIIRKVDFV